MTYPSPPRRGPRGLVAAVVFGVTVALTGTVVVYLVVTGWGLLTDLWSWALG